MAAAKVADQLLGIYLAMKDKNRKLQVTRNEEMLQFATVTTICNGNTT